MAESSPENAPEAAQTPDAASDAAAETAEAADATNDATATAAGESAATATASAPTIEPPSAPAEIDLSQLPLHTRSLLKIKVAVTVTLARQQRPIEEIIEMGPGTLVKFEKTYDEPLELTVGDLPIARGDVVKVGDKFGLRIGKIIRAHERFASVTKS